MIATPTIQFGRQASPSHGHYNATVASIYRVHGGLMILRVRPDSGIPRLQAGQYTVLGLGAWEPRIQTGDAPRSVRGGAGGRGTGGELIRRVYSLSCPMLDEAGRLVGVNDVDFLEFYITLVQREDNGHPPLTPRIFALRPGDRIQCGPKIGGRYTLAGVPDNAAVIFAATGTGEAPQNAMVAELLSRGHRAPIVSVTCVRYRRDLAYEPTHRELERRYPNYRYVALTTREPENLDPDAPGYVGKRYLQDYFASGAFEAETGVVLEPSGAHVFLCGNPQMIGAGGPAAGTGPGMISILEERGFRAARGRQASNIHYEKFW